MHLFILCISFWTALMSLDLPMVILRHSWLMRNCLMDPKTSLGVDTETQTQTRGGAGLNSTNVFCFHLRFFLNALRLPEDCQWEKRVTNSRRTKTKARQWFNALVGRRECWLCSWLTYVYCCALERREVNAALPRGLTVKEKKNQSVVLLLINLPLNITANLNSPVLHKCFLGNYVSTSSYISPHLSRFEFFVTAKAHI